MLQGNKGEWSEVYTLLRLLSDGVVSAGDKDLNKIVDLVYPILKILRDDRSGLVNYTINDNIVFVNDSNGDCIEIPIIKFKESADLLLTKILESHGASFRIMEMEEFLNMINCSSLRASSSSKSDLKIVIHDLKTNLQPILGYSIKSQLGGASTLLNAGKTTNFVYQIINCSLDTGIIDGINGIDSRSKVKDRISEIYKNGGEIIFNRLEKEIFGNNLVLVDSLLPQIFGRLLLDFYSSGRNSVQDLVSFIEKENPLQYNTSNSHKFYEYKVKKLLVESALGMMPSKVWNGVYDATGGYLIVKDDGEVLSYHMYNKNMFEDYLFKNTKFETPSTTKYDFARVYKDSDRLFIKLNLQIRFKK